MVSLIALVGEKSDILVGSKPSWESYKSYINSIEYITVRLLTNYSKENSDSLKVSNYSCLI